MTAEYYLPREVAARLRISVRTVYQWIDDGVLPAVKVGGTVRIPVEPFEALLKARKTKP